MCAAFTIENIEITADNLSNEIIESGVYGNEDEIQSDSMKQAIETLDNIVWPAIEHYDKTGFIDENAITVALKLIRQNINNYISEKCNKLLQNLQIDNALAKDAEMNINKVIAMIVNYDATNKWKYEAFSLLDKIELQIDGSVKLQNITEKQKPKKKVTFVENLQSVSNDVNWVIEFIPYNGGGKYIVYDKAKTPYNNTVRIVNTLEEAENTAKRLNKNYIENNDDINATISVLDEIEKIS